MKRFRSSLSFRAAAFGFVVAATASVTLTTVHSSEVVSWHLEQFEQPIRVVQPNEPDPRMHYLWNLYTDNGVDSATDLITTISEDGAQSLHNRFDQSLAGFPSGSTTLNNWQFEFYPYTVSLPGFTDGWQFMRNFVSNPETYTTGKTNRMRFWIKVPPGLTQSTSGNHNFEFGTYIRCSTCTGAEDGGGHFYHYFDFKSTGQWQQVIVDTHPDHSRGDDGNTERPDRLYPTNEPGFTYYDLMTRFYLDFPYVKFDSIKDFYIDGFEVYQESNPENVDQVRALTAVYVPTTNEIQVGWTRRKDQDTVKHEVRYAFSDVFSLGWSNAIPAPNGTVTPPGSGGYNNMLWSTTQIDVSGRSKIYIAIKPQNSSSFRQISIPIASSMTSGPSAPSNVRIVSN